MGRFLCLNRTVQICISCLYMLTCVYSHLNTLRCVYSFEQSVMVKLRKMCIFFVSCFVFPMCSVSEILFPVSLSLCVFCLAVYRQGSWSVLPASEFHFFWMDQLPAALCRANKKGRCSLISRNLIICDELYLQIVQRFGARGKVGSTV
jgi:hypothetical protein